ncbi:hypothetical protein B0H14DRAFT_2594641 [Mycena olivaceomarginata]|nr:hypothetical protein B0H14DRAFT_2594641 [Mycena olivaceomarginata]
MRGRASTHRVGATATATSACAAAGVNPKELTEPITWAQRRRARVRSAQWGQGGGHWVGAQQLQVTCMCAAPGKHPEETTRGQGGRGAAHAVRTGSAPQGWAARAWMAHGGHTEEGVGALGYTWRRVWPNRIGSESPGSER